MVVSRDLLDKILDYPLLTYITLLPRTIINSNQLVLPIPHPNVEFVLDQSTLMERMRVLGVNRELTVDFAKDILVVATNLKVLDMKYRTVRVTAVVDEQKNHLQVFTVRRSYFYSRSIYITCFSLRGQKVNIPTRVYHL